MHYPLITHFFTTFLVTRAIIHTKHFARQNTIPPPLFWPCSSPPDICSGVGGASLALILVVPESQATNAFSPHFDESLRGVLCGGLEVTATATLSTSVSGPTITYLVCVFLYLHHRHEQLHSKLEHSIRFSPSMRECASTSVLRYSRSPLWCFFHFIVGSERHDYLTVDVCYRFQHTYRIKHPNDFVNSTKIYHGCFSLLHFCSIKRHQPLDLFCHCLRQEPITQFLHPAPGDFVANTYTLPSRSLLSVR